MWISAVTWQWSHSGRGLFLAWCGVYFFFVFFFWEGQEVSGLLAKAFLNSSQEAWKTSSAQLENAQEIMAQVGHQTALNRGFHQLLSHRPAASLCNSQNIFKNKCSSLITKMRLVFVARLMNQPCMFFSACDFADCECSFFKPYFHINTVMSCRHSARLSQSACLHHILCPQPFTL